MTIRAGANVEELRALALQFGKASKELGSRGQELSAVLGRLDVWRGNDAEQFKQQWSRLHRPALLAVSRQLQEASRTLLANADVQEQTSEASTGALAAAAPSALGVLYDVYETAGGVKAFGRIFAEGLWAELREHGVDVLELVLGVTRTPAMERAGLNFDVPGMHVSEPADVAREGLAALPHGPVHVVSGNETIVEMRSTADRARLVAGSEKVMRLLVPHD